MALLFLTGISARAFTVVQIWQDASGHPLSLAKGYLLPDGISTNGNAITTRDRLPYTNDASGQVNYTNLAVGGYTASVTGPYTVTPIHFTVTNAVGTNYAWQLTTPATNAGPGFAWSSSVSDLRYQFASSNLSNFSLLTTNALAYITQLQAATNALLASLAAQSNWAAITFQPLNSDLTMLATRNGGRLTNLLYLSLARDFGVTGSGDETAKVQAAAYAGVPVLLDTNFTTTNVFGTNRTHFIGDGHSRWSFGTNGIGYLLTVATNCSNVVIEGVIADGLNYSFQGTGGTLPWGFTAQSNVIWRADVARSFLLIGNASANSGVFNCFVTGMGDCGYRFTGAEGGTPQPLTPRTYFINCHANLCWEGADWTNNAEYQAPIGFEAENCGRGISKEAGNVFHTGVMLTGNGCGEYVDGAGNNPAHGRTSGCFNHNFVSIICANFNNGEHFDNCQIQGNGDIYITNCTGVIISGGSIGSSTVIVVDGGAGDKNGVNRLENCDVTGYPLIKILNGGILQYPELNNIFDNAPRTNNIPIVYTVPPVADGRAITNLVASAPGWTNQSLATAGGTNYTINLSGAPNVWMAVTNDVCFQYFTNGPGAVSVHITDIGATNHNFLLPTNMHVFNTNFFTALQGTNGQGVVTNTHETVIVLKSDINPNPAVSNMTAIIGQQ